MASDKKLNMKIRTFFAVTMLLLLTGTLASIISLFLPLFFPMDFLSTAGDISAGVSAVFGMSIACLALFIYLYRDSTEQKVADETFKAKEVLEDALIQASSLIKVTAEINNGAIPGSDRCVRHALVILRDATAKARQTSLYAALSSVTESEKSYNPADLIVTLEAHVSADLQEGSSGVSYTVFGSIPPLHEALSLLTADNMKLHSGFNHGKRGEIEFMKKIAEYITSQKA